MKLKYFFALCTFLITMFGYSQNPIWTFPNNTSSGYYSFGTGNLPLPTTDPVLTTTYTNLEGPGGGYVPSLVGHKGAANAISGPDGNLLFFVIGGNIFDKYGRTIFTSYAYYNYQEAFFGFTDIMVVPNPGNCTQFYLFTEALDPGFSNTSYPLENQPMYAILDISEQQTNFDYNLSADGNLIQPFQPLFPLAGIVNSSVPKLGNVQYASTKSATANEFVILCEASTYFMRFKLTTAGLQFVAAIDNTSFGVLDGPFDRSEFEVITLPSGDYRVAVAGQGDMYVFDLNPINLNLVSGSFHTITIAPIAENTSVAGVEFTSDGRYVYITHTPTSIRPKIIDCYNIPASSWVTLPASWVNPISVAPAEFQYSFIEMGTTGNMYLVNSTTMAEISNVDNPTSSTFNGTFQPVNYAANYYSDLSFTTLQDKRYTLPDQIDGFDYAAYFDNDPSCCIASWSYDKDDYTADPSFTGGSNQTWTDMSNPLNGGTGNIVYMSGDLVIPSGINVSIQGMTIYFHPDSRVIIERSDNPLLQDGAKLTMSNTIFTVIPECGDGFMWQGVEVQGWLNQAQTPINNSRQGYLYMANNARIEHAIVGAQAYDSDPTDGVDASNRGGIIRTTNSTFYNNRIDVKIYNYTHPTSGGVTVDNQCLFNNTVFMTDGFLNDVSYTPLAHAFLYQSGGIKFTGCDFINTLTDNYAELSRGMGIYNIRNKLTVIPACTTPSIPCTSTDPNTFTNLSYGIYSIASAAMISTYIAENNFINNHTGVYLGGLVGSVIQDNNFEVLHSLHPDITYNKTTGIYLRGCTGYNVTGNNLSEVDGDINPLGGTRGIVVDNSGELDNQIYKNTFHDIAVGGQSQKINAPNHLLCGDNSCVGGLQWKCNDFQNNIEVDLYVPSGRIDYQQGFYLHPSELPDVLYSGALNLFNHEMGDYEIVTGPTPLVQSFVYTHYDNPNTIPISTMGLSTNQLINLGIVYSNSCKNKKTVIAGPGSGVSVYVGPKNQLKIDIENEKAKIDGGNTSALLTQIQNSSGGNLKNLLMSYSPYLSDEVLLAYLAKNPPAGHVNQILQANSPLSDAVLAQFNSMSYPNGIKNQVNSVQNGTSPMEFLTNKINYLTREREYYVDEIIRFYLNDTIVVNPMDSIIQLLIDEDSQIRKEELCDAYIIKGDLANATFVRSAIITEYGASNYTDLAEINIETRSSSDPIDAANSDPAMHAVIEYIANDATDPRICPRGEGMLYEYIYANGFVHEIEDLILPGQAPKSQIYSDDIVDDQPLVSVYPNPANTFIFVEIVGLENTENVMIDFYNLMGQKMMSVPLADGQLGVKIDLALIPAGIYFVHVLNSDESISVTKVVIE